MSCPYSSMMLDTQGTRKQESSMLLYYPHRYGDEETKNKPTENKNNKLLLMQQGCVYDGQTFRVHWCELFGAVCLEKLWIRHQCSPITPTLRPLFSAPWGKAIVTGFTCTVFLLYFIHCYVPAYAMAGLLKSLRSIRHVVSSMRTKPLVSRKAAYVAAFLFSFAAGVFFLYLHISIFEVLVLCYPQITWPWIETTVQDLHRDWHRLVLVIIEYVRAVHKLTNISSKQKRGK